MTPMGMRKEREVSHGATPTPRPWAWEANGPHPGDITLGGADDPSGEFHVLTPHICPSCRESGHTCLAPSDADAALIVEAVNAYDQLRAEVETLRGALVTVAQWDSWASDWLAKHPLAAAAEVVR